jgi:hypothetical protein
MAGMEEKLRMLMHSSEDAVNQLAQRLQISIDQLFRRIARNENQVVELSTTTDQIKVFKKKKVEFLEK